MLIEKIIQICIARSSLLHILYSFYGEVLKGYFTYKRLKQKTDGAKIFLQYYQGTGDVYLSSAYMKYCEQGQSKIENAVFAVNGTNAYKVASLLEIRNVPIIKLTKKEAYSLVHLTRFIGQANIDITYLHYMSDYPMYTCFLIKLAGLHGIGFMDLYRDFVFCGEVFDLPIPQWESCESVVNHERKVLLAPAANSIAEGPADSFWRRLAVELKLQGYEVYTNVAGGEEPIEGTKSVSIPYRKLASFLDNKTIFIGYRSGLCDLVAPLKCKKIIIYPNSSWPLNDGLGIGSTLDIFSLNKMGICGDAIEVEYCAADESDILFRILREIADCY